MENHFEKRLNPQLLNEGAKSVISLLYNYYSNQKQTATEAPIISKYAYSKDYHIVIKEKLNQLLDFIKTIGGEVKGRVFVDTAPVLERAWAKQAGLGWIGKNGNLLNRNLGSFFFIAEIITDLELDYNKELAQNYCGQCTRCIDACPTNAIVAQGRVDARKCIAYLTIELKEEIPIEFKGKMQNRVFGCDICQDVCPFNKKSKQNTDPNFTPVSHLMELSKEDWFNMDEKTFSVFFKNSAVQRAKFRGLKRNLDFINPIKNSKQ